MCLADLQKAIVEWKLNTERPFSNFGTREIETGTLAGLNQSWPDLEVATVALDELKHRARTNSYIARNCIETRLDEIGHQQIQWLFKTRERLKVLAFEDKPNQNYTTSLYVILRDGYTEQNGRYGVYVGQTKNKPDHRFKEHVTGVNAGKGLKQNGMHFMRSLMWPWQKVPGAKRFYYESALHKALEIGNIDGLKVTGDVVPIEEWPKNFQNKLRKYIKSTNEVEK